MPPLRYLLLLCVLIASPACGQASSDPIVGLDGTITAKERQAATDSLTGDGGALYLRSEDGLLWVGVASDSIGVASLCVGSKAEVRVLHASAALGMLTFARRDDGWRTQNRFVWGLRDTTTTADALAARRAYLADHGWVAATAPMGRPGHAEFLLRPDAWPGGVAFAAVGIMPSERPDEILGLPASGAGDCASGDLVRGIEPTTGLTFDPAAWVTIDGP